MIEWLSQPWPWYVVGPLIGMVVALLLAYGAKVFGISSTFRHACAAFLPGGPAFFRYDWKREGLWNLIFALGAVLGGVVSGTVLAPSDPVIGVAAETRADLAALGVEDHEGYAPSDVFSFDALGTIAGVVALVGGGFLLGFGARWAGGCTSGHAISGLANFQLPSFIAVVGFFVGGLFVTHVMLPALLP